jgi:hypothetical protein
MEINRRTCLTRGVALAAGGCGTSWAQTPDKTLPTLVSLPESLDQALQRKQPLVVMVSLVGCPFCKVVRENYLLPLHASGIPVVQIDMRDHRAVLDMDGATLTQDAWIRKRNIKIAPTVLFFGAKGREVATRLNGAYLPDFYNAYLEEQLTVAQRAIQP